MIGKPTSPYDPNFTFGEHLRAQRLEAAKQPPVIEAFPELEPYRPPPARPEHPPSKAPVVRRRQRISHIQREASARLRELREGQA